MTHLVLDIHDRSILPQNHASIRKADEHWRSVERRVGYPSAPFGLPSRKSLRERGTIYSLGGNFGVRGSQRKWKKCEAGNGVIRFAFVKQSGATYLNGWAEKWNGLKLSGSCLTCLHYFFWRHIKILKNVTQVVNDD
ncbi:hypothetical protein AVEN_97926-1 [Araneus ventricosus]|uniref:Uncharacterized protein n=1 Tax=Araneus ventricosus TaxID=182803 RepID=A0A4Y1ZND5_ARAVE|nr:hypothetical protein AVEN_97926-1 [Araneus ventricosus]